MSPEQPSSKIGKSVGEKLRAARLTQHYTQSQLAAPDFSVSYISAIERGQIHPSLRALEILAARLGLTSTQLLPNRSQQEDRFGLTTNAISHDDEELDLALLEAHILIIQGSIERAIQQLDNFPTKRLKRFHQLEQRYLLGWAYYKKDSFQESETALSEGEQIAKELNTSYFHLRILNQLAITYSAMRNYAQALQAHQRCINLLEASEPYDPFFTIQVYIQTGQHYTRLQNFDQALEVFNKALAITRTLDTPKDVQAAYASLSFYYAKEKNAALSTLYAYKSSQIHNYENIKRLRSEIYHYLGHAIMQGDLQTARNFLDEALQTSTILQDPLTLASIYTRNAEWYFNQQAWQEAETYEKQAFDLAQPFGESIILAEVLIMLGRTEYAQEHFDEGEQHLTTGLDMLEHIGSHQELADESVRYAELLEKLGKDREAFTHFRRAFQSKRRLGE